MARRPNYGFERRERERRKAEKRQRRQEERAEKTKARKLKAEGVDDEAAVADEAPEGRTAGTYGP